MTQHVETRSGTRIAYDREGAGPAVILVGGAGQFRAGDAATRALTSELPARGCDVLHYDRPGRGESEGDAPFTLDGEVEAIGALVEVVGGSATVFGSSSGGVIALAAAAQVPGVQRLVLWEVPLGEQQGLDGAALLAEIRALVLAGDREGTWRHFMHGMPPEWFDGMRTGPLWPSYERMAPTLQADAEALAWAQSAPFRELWGGVTAPTLVLVGTTAFPFMSGAADALVDALPHAERGHVAGADHRWDPVDLAAHIAAHARRA
jgi:pimeloyl-ACP methyl ester carboxylesterase